MNTTAKWTGAIVFSLLVHAGAGYAVLPDTETELEAVAGGETMEVAVLGNAFSDSIEAGTPDDAIEPVVDETEAEQPVETPPVETAEQAVEPLAADVPPEVAPDVAPKEADVILPSEEIAPVEAEDPMVSATVAPETVLPQPRPEPEKAKPEKKVERKVEKLKPARRKAGDEGTAKASERKGQADGSATAEASTGGSERGAFAGAVGNAAVSNYPGKVRARLNRAFRYPSEAKRAGVTGTAVVSFSVSASGAVSNVRVVRSTGSSILDGAAIDAVQRAAPFPKIPDGRASWPFSIPLVYGGR